jgi:hypothetical protein
MISGEPMATRQQDIAKNIAIHDTGRARLDRLAALEQIRHEFRELACEAFGKPSIQVADDGDRAWVYHCRTGFLKIGGGTLRFMDLLSDANDRMTRQQAVAFAERAIALETRYMRVKFDLPADPDPTKGHTARSRESSRCGVGGFVALGSDDANDGIETHTRGRAA